MDFLTAFNSLEAVFWFVFGCALLLCKPRLAGTRRLQTTAGLWLVLFGISDAIEVRTGAWWRPWWLLVWKGACVVALVLCWVRFVRARCAAGKQNDHD